MNDLLQTYKSLGMYSLVCAFVLTGFWVLCVVLYGYTNAAALVLGVFALTSFLTSFGLLVAFCIGRLHERRLEAAPPPYMPTEKDPLFAKHPFKIGKMNELEQNV